MENVKYNGWTNYSTWRVNLEFFYTYELNEFEVEMDSYELADSLCNYVETILNDYGSGVTLDYALSFINDVNWVEIAQHLLEGVMRENVDSQPEE
jgi:hypothetical protein